VTRVTAGIFGVGAALPEQVIANSHFERLETSDDWIVRRTGIRERRWLNGAMSVTDLAAQASRLALADSGVDAQEIDRVIVSTITPDHVTPGIAPALVCALGLGEAGAFDVNAACAGFVYAVDQAAALVESGRARAVLVCAAEALSRLTDHEDRSTAILFGDGAAAVIVAGGELELGCAPFVLGADGDHAELLYADNDERVLRMSGQEVFRHAVARMSSAMRKALDANGMQVSDLDLLVAHQANARIVEAVGNELGIAPERLAVNIDHLANTSSASIPLALWEAERDGRLRAGARVGLVAFGSGFVWGAGVISWKERAYVRS
jgi:3-oxoacyl-[acyl-carrier-protein] synthase-3